jgi:4'-phosphopantetheinyl transferase EntD
VIADLLPPAVACADATEDAPESVLFEAEAALVARAVAKRRREFTTARHCARRALAQLGLPPTPILTGERGAPQWPAGVVGSLTHCEGYRAAAVAWAAQVPAVGIDAEPHAPLPEGVAGLVVRPEEAERLAKLAAANDRVAWDRLLFSAKESIYKVWYPLTHRWLEFEEASVTLAPDGTFHARLLVPGLVVAGAAVTDLEGRWLATDTLLATGIALTSAAAD